MGRAERADILYSSAETLLSKPNDLKVILEEFFNVQIPRLDMLETYDSGDNTGITLRPARKEDEGADYRAKHNYGGYISTFQTGYMFGIPVKIEHDDENIKKIIDEIAEINDINNVNAEIGYDCSCYGRGYELHYRNSEDEDKIAISSVFETFIIYDTTVEKKPIMGIRCPRYTNSDGDLVVEVTVYTDTQVIKYKPTKIDKIDLRIEAEEINLYGIIPIVEWKNNTKKTGDYEKVISLIDLYDYTQSDTANYMHDLNDALLVIAGDLDSDKYSAKDLAEMKKANIMLLESSLDYSGKPTSMSAQYLYKKYDVAGKEAYNKRIQDDIHKFSYTPDLTDDSFANAQSGVAMKYKLFGLEQLRSKKEKEFKKALKQRYRIIDSMRAYVRESSLDPENLNIIFTENLPEDEWSEIKDFYSVGGELAKKTLLERLSFVGSAQHEMNKIRDELYDYTNTEYKPSIEQDRLTEGIEANAKTK